MANSKQSDSTPLKVWIHKRVSGLQKLSKENDPQTNMSEYLAKTLQTRWYILEKMLPEKVLLAQFSALEITWIQVTLEDHNFPYGSKDMSDGEKNICAWIESKIPLWVASYILQLSQVKSSS